MGPVTLIARAPLEKTGVARQVIPFKRVALTDIKIKVPKNARHRTSSRTQHVASKL